MCHSRSNIGASAGASFDIASLPLPLPLYSTLHLVNPAPLTLLFFLLDISALMDISNSFHLIIFNHSFCLLILDGHKGNKKTFTSMRQTPSSEHISLYTGFWIYSLTSLSLLTSTIVFSWFSFCCSFIPSFHTLLSFPLHLPSRLGFCILFSFYPLSLMQVLSSLWSSAAIVFLLSCYL